MNNLSAATLYDNNENGDDQKMTPLLLQDDEHNDNDHAVVVTAPISNCKLKLASLIISSVFGCCVQLTAILTTSVWSSNHLSYYALVVGGILATLCQSWIVSRPRTASFMDVILWSAVAVLSFQSGLFFAWIISEYTISNQPPRVAYYYAILEVLCLSKFMLLAWAIVLEPENEAPVEESVEDSTTLSSAATESDHKLKLGALVLAYALGYCAELSGTMVKSSYWATTFLVCGTLLTMLQAWITTLYFASSSISSPSSCNAINMTLWIAAAVLSYQGGFYCAWSLNDFMLGQCRLMVLHIVLEVMCIGMSILSTWVADFDELPLGEDEDEDEEFYLAMEEPAMILV